MILTIPGDMWEQSENDIEDPFQIGSKHYVLLSHMLWDFSCVRLDIICQLEMKRLSMI